MKVKVIKKFISGRISGNVGEVFEVPTATGRRLIKTAIAVEEQEPEQEPEAEQEPEQEQEPEPEAEQEPEAVATSQQEEAEKKQTVRKGKKAGK